MRRFFFRFLIIFLAIFVFWGGKAQAGVSDNVSGWAWSDMDDPTTPADERSIGWVSFNCNSKVDTDGDGITDESMKVCDGGANKNKVCNSGFSEAAACGAGANCADACGAAGYGVNIAADGVFSGYAWSENVGWIDFAPVGDLAVFPGCGYPSSPCDSAKADLATGEVFGWARALAFGGGWAGWIKLAGDGKNWNGARCVGSNDYGNTNRCDWGVKIDKNTGKFSGWAWSDMVIGWLKFNSVATTLVLNRPPFVVPGSQIIDYESYCGLSAGQGQIGFQWTYDDPENDPQDKYDFQVDTDSNFGSPDVDVTNNNPISDNNTEAVLVVKSPVPGAKEVAFGQTYYWRVRVWDDKGNNSGWISASAPENQFTTLSHALPFPSFSHNPANPAVGEIVVFTDSSKCYDIANNEYPCKNSATNRYEWDFGNGATCDSNIKPACRGNATTTYGAARNYTVKLKITDNTLLGPNNYCLGLGDSPVGITLPLPEWREIPPVFWLEKFLASVVQLQSRQSMNLR